VSDFLLLGVRPWAPAELSPVRTAHDVAASAVWHRWLRRWGLLRSFALPPAGPAGPLGSRAEARAYLVVRASGRAAADRLAADWGRVGGYQVHVLPLRDAIAGERR
jgi:hypothetical protein